MTAVSFRRVWYWRGNVKENLIAFNKIENSPGGGILLRYFDVLPSTEGFPIVSKNIVRNNKINNPGGKGIILNGYTSHLNNNFISFNDFRGCLTEVLLVGANLLGANSFSRNLGYQSPNEDNRGLSSVDDLDMYQNLPTQ
jgi:hypothetical protein